MVLFETRPDRMIASSFEAHRDRLAGKQVLEPHLQRRDAWFNDDVMLAADVAAPDDQRIVPGPCRRSESRG
jgi:hypothetical protein